MQDHLGAKSANWLAGNLVPREVSEPLFQSSSQKTTLVQGVVFYGEFDFIAMKFRMDIRVWFRWYQDKNPLDITPGQKPPKPKTPRTKTPRTNFVNDKTFLP